MHRSPWSRVAVVAALLVVLPASAHAQSARASIDAVNARFMAASNKGDAATVASLYSADATLMPPNNPALKGRDAIAAYWGGGFKAGVKNLVLKTTELVAHGDMAHEMGTYALDIQPPTGAVMHDTGKFIVIWKRGAKGHWQLHRDIWNSDMPAAH